MAYEIEKISNNAWVLYDETSEDPVNNIYPIQDILVIVDTEFASQINDMLHSVEDYGYVYTKHKENRSYLNFNEEQSYESQTGGRMGIYGRIEKDKFNQYEIKDMFVNGTELKHLIITKIGKSEPVAFLTLHSLYKIEAAIRFMAEFEWYFGYKLFVLAVNSTL